MNTEQIIKATKVLEGAKVMVVNRYFNEFQDAIITAINALALIKEQEERIKELEVQDTERLSHIQRLNECRIAAEEQARKANAELEELRAYNGTLQKENKYLRERLAEEAKIKEDMKGK